MTDNVKGRFTFRFAAVCFGISAILEVLAIQQEVPLFGQLLTGNAAVAYHFIYTGLFAWLASGLWNGNRSSYYALMITTVIYSVDRLQLALARDTLIALIRKEFAGQEQLLQQFGMDFLLQAFTTAIIVMMLCWWGFAAYTYLRRAYFGIQSGSK